MIGDSDDQMIREEADHPIFRSSDHPVIGVLSLQGAVEPHRAHIDAAGGTFLKVKRAEDFERADAFILPGGESTTMLKLIDAFGLEEVMRDHFARKPVWGICAGAILMAETVNLLPLSATSSRRTPGSIGNVSSADMDPVFQRDDDFEKAQKSFSLLPMTVTRNAYGRQLDSIQQEIEGYTVSYIRAPVIESVGEGVEILAEREGKPVWVRKGRYMATTFHAEMTLDFPSPMHRAFVALIEKSESPLANRA